KQPLKRRHRALRPFSRDKSRNAEPRTTGIRRYEPPPPFQHAIRGFGGRPVWIFTALGGRREIRPDSPRIACAPPAGRYGSGRTSTGLLWGGVQPRSPRSV